MYYVRLHQNIRILCRLVRELDGIDTSRVFVNGGSQGGGLGLACAALNPELIDRAAILYPFLSDFKLVWDLGADEIAYEGLRYYARWFDADEHQQDRWFRQLGYIDSKNFALMIRCPVLFGTGDWMTLSARRRPSAPCTTICTAPRSGISSPGTGMRRSRNLTICCWTFSPARRLCYDHHRAKGIFAQLHRQAQAPADFAQRWQETAAALHPAVSCAPVTFGNPCGVYERLTVIFDGRSVTARSSAPPQTECIRCC